MVVCSREVLPLPTPRQELIHICPTKRLTFLFSCLMDIAVPISVCMVGSRYKIDVQVLQFHILPLIDTLSDFEDASSLNNLSDGFDTAINDPTILLDHYLLPNNNCSNLVEGIIRGTASTVSDSSFDPASPIGPAGSSAIILASSTKCHARFYTKACNWVTGPESS